MDWLLRRATDKLNQVKFSASFSCTGKVLVIRWLVRVKKSSGDVQGYKFRPRELWPLPVWLVVFWARSDIGIWKCPLGCPIPYSIYTYCLEVYDSGIGKANHHRIVCQPASHHQQLVLNFRFRPWTISFQEPSVSSISVIPVKCGYKWRYRQRNSKIFKAGKSPRSSGTILSESIRYRNGGSEGELPILHWLERRELKSKVS